MLRTMAALLRRPATAAALLAMTAAIAAACLWPIDAARPGAATVRWVPLRVLKADLIEHLPSAPQVVVLGGSRATRFDPAFITARTRLRAFNAAVTHARPEDAWAFVNLLHATFPEAGFRFLWVVHVDEFGGHGPARALLSDATLARYFPPSYVARWSRRLHVETRTYPEMGQTAGMTVAPDGYVVHSAFDDRALTTPLADSVAQTTRTTLYEYARYPPALQVGRRHYFEKTLSLMQSRGDSVDIVLAPLQPQYLAAIRAHGWSLRHRLAMRYLSALQARYGFALLDLSDPASVHASPTGFYDGIHLRAGTSRRVFATVLRRLPRLFD